MHTQALFDNIPQHIIAELNKATHSIVIAVAWFTRADIFAVLLQKARAGISIQLALSNDRINKNEIAINQDELNHFNHCQTYWIGDGIFKARSETVTALDKLKIIKQQLSQKVAQLKQAIDEIENSESYRLVSEIVDWDSYFDEQKEQLTQERDRLTKNLGDMLF